MAVLVGLELAFVGILFNALISLIRTFQTGFWDRGRRVNTVVTFSCWIMATGATLAGFYLIAVGTIS